MPEQREPTTTADEFADLGPRIARALLKAHGEDRFALTRIQEDFAAKLDVCFYCKYFPRGRCQACRVKLEVLVEIDKHLGQTLPLPLEERQPDTEQPPAQVSP